MSSSIALETEEHVFYATPDADETGGTYMYEKTDEGLVLVSDNFLAYNELTELMGDIYFGRLLPIYVSDETQYSIEEMAKQGFWNED